MRRFTGGSGAQNVFSWNFHGKYYFWVQCYIFLTENENPVYLQETIFQLLRNKIPILSHLEMFIRFCFNCTVYHSAFNFLKSNEFVSNHNICSVSQRLLDQKWEPSSLSWLTENSRGWGRINNYSRSFQIALVTAFESNASALSSFNLLGSSLWTLSLI